MSTPTLDASSSTLDAQNTGLHVAPLVPDSDSSETDSALGESVAGSQYTTSLASSVLNYQYENGRRYHAYCRGRYILPNDEVEQERLDILHHIFKMICGGAIFRVPLFTHMRPQRVLDMGCGTGIWAIEFADDWPETTVIGTDLSPIQPSWIPPNCKFYVDDIEGEWTYPAAEHFDYIHGRALHGSIGDWRGLFSKAFNHLKPGGFLEIQDFRGGIGSDDDGMRHVPYLADWVEKVGEGMRMMGRAGKMAHLKGYMEELGFVDIHEETCKIPVGPWAKGQKNKDLGIFWQAHAMASIEPYTLALFTRLFGYSEEEVHATIARVKNDLQNRRAHLYVPFSFVWGRKPE